MRIYTFTKDFTVSGGAASFNTPEFRGERRLLQVKPTTATNKYTLTITNSDSVVVHRETVNGTLFNDSIKPLYGIYTIAISGATTSEAFSLRINYVDLQ